MRFLLAACSYCLCLLGLLLLAGCASEASAPSAGGAATDPYAAVEGTDSEKMRRVLAAIYEEANVHPQNYFYLNSRRAEVLHDMLQQAPKEQHARIIYSHAYELLYAGQTEAAIRELEDLLRQMQAGPHHISHATKPIVDVLAIAYMRLGEQQNCIDNPAAAACILPISEEAQHTRPEGSRRAIMLYQQLLRQYPADLSARWLLNVAYMTLGGYPEEVPDRWRISKLVPEPDARIPSFHNVAPALGVDQTGLSGGVSVEDFNNDGFLDILATSYGLNDPIKLYLNDGQGGFTDHTRAAGLEGLVSGLNTVHADYNNDGFVDVLVLRGAWLGAAGRHPNSLLRNNGDGSFTDVTYRAGLASYHPTQTAAWGDVNNDGWIDLFVGNESNQAVDVLTGQTTRDSTAHPSELYLNNGDGTFTEVAQQVGIDVDAFVKGSVWGDVNNDGLLDLYISVMGGPNRLYVNQGGTGLDDWRFEERAAEAGVQEPIYSFPTWFWDYDHNGHQDLFVAGYDPQRFSQVAHDVAAEYMGLQHGAELPRVYHNNGDGTFTDVSSDLNLDKVMYAMGSNYGDLDGDGFLDFYVGTGAPDFQSIIPNRMFRNRNGEVFEEVTFAGGFAHIQKGHAVGFGDFDNDGDQDLYCVIGGAVEGDTFQNALFENPGHDHAWTTLRLEGRSANRAAIGARLVLTVSDRQGRRQTFHHIVSTGGSFGASSLQQEMGLGEAVRIDTLRVTWPNAEGTTQVFTGLPVNQAFQIIEGADAPQPLDRKAIPFKEAGPAAPHAHRGL